MFARKRFGVPVQKVNVDAGFTCPNRDGSLGYSGCIYCNNDTFRPGSCKPTLSIGEQIRNGIRHLKKRYGAEKFIVYFQPYTNTYAPVETLERLYNEALEEPSVIGLAIGTRPDCIDEEKILLMQSIASSHYMLIEYGLQSIYDKSLEFIKRGHNYKAFLDAVEMTKNRGIDIGAHVIAGFPTETRQETLGMAEEVSLLPINFIKIHQLQIVRETPLSVIYRKNPFHVFGYEEYLDFVVDFVERLSPGIVVQRLFATAPDDMLMAPVWNKGRHEILRDIEKRFELRDAYQGKKYSSPAALLDTKAL